LPQVRKLSAKKYFKVKEKFGNFILRSGKIDILKKGHVKLKQFFTADLIPLKAGRNILGHCDLNVLFPLVNEEEWKKSCY